MNLFKTILLFMFILACEKLFSQAKNPTDSKFSLSIDGNYSFQYYNCVLQPSQTGTPLRLDQSTNDVPFLYQVRFSYSINSRKEIRVSYTPFIRNGTYLSNSDVFFDDKLFVGNEKIDTRFMFNLYRIGFVWKGFKKAEGLRLGVTLVLRQGGVHLVSSSNSRKNNDAIIVPLLYIAYHKNITKKLLTETDLDFFALPFGYVYEGSASLYYKLTPPLRIGVQYRTLGGYVDISNVENRLLTQSLGLSVSYHF
jgi:hypothetical protein